MKSNLDTVPSEILTRICAHLHFRDLVALEGVSQALHAKIVKGNIWARVGTTLSVYPGQEPLNIFSVDRAELGWIGICTNTLIKTLVRCAPGVRELDLASWRLLETEQPIGQYFWRTAEATNKDDDPENDVAEPLFPVRVDFDDARVWTALGQCPRLAILDISDIPLSGLALVNIARTIGQSLEVARLQRCFQGYGHVPYHRNCDLTNEQFTEFLVRTPNLQELDIAYCGRNVFQSFAFSAISSGLKTLISTSLSVQQLFEVSRKCPRLGRLRLNVSSEKEFTQTLLDKLFASLSCLEHLRLGLHAQDKDFKLCLGSEACASLRSIWLMGWNLVDDTTLVHSLFQNAVHNLPRLEQVHLTCSGGGRGVLPPMLRMKFRPVLRNVCRLILEFCPAIDDAMLADLAELGRLEELIISGCPLVSWRAFAFCLDKCMNLRLVGNSEQMTDELLQLIHTVMDNRYCSDGGAAARPKDRYDRRLFTFVRRPIAQQTVEVGLKNDACVQTTSENMHPWVLWTDGQRSNECWANW